MPDLDRLVAALVDRVAAEIPAGVRWRLVLIGSAAARETSRDRRSGRWLSDIEAYLECPDPRRELWLETLRRALSGRNPSIDLSAGDPDAIRSWPTRQWLVDAGRVGRRIGGMGDSWEDPFAAFADRPVPRSEAAVLLANRCAGLLDGGNHAYPLAKAVIDTVGAALIVVGRHQPTVRGRLEALRTRDGCAEVLATGIAPGLVGAFHLACAWKLEGDPAAEDAFRAGEGRTVALLRRSIRELLRRSFGPGAGDGTEELERWARSRGRERVVRDWLRALRNAPWVWSRFLRWWDVGPLWGARLEVVRAWAGDVDATHRRRALDDWKILAKGV